MEKAVVSLVTHGTKPPPSFGSCVISDCQLQGSILASTQDMLEEIEGQGCPNLSSKAYHLYFLDEEIWTSVIIATVGGSIWTSTLQTLYIQYTQWGLLISAHLEAIH